MDVYEHDRIEGREFTLAIPKSLWDVGRETWAVTASDKSEFVELLFSDYGRKIMPDEKWRLATRPRYLSNPPAGVENAADFEFWMCRFAVLVLADRDN